MFEPEMLEEKDARENCIIRSFMICIDHKILCGWADKGSKLGGVCNTNWGEEIRARFCWGNV